MEVVRNEKMVNEKEKVMIDIGSMSTGESDNKESDLSS